MTARSLTLDDTWERTWLGQQSGIYIGWLDGPEEPEVIPVWRKSNIRVNKLHTKIGKAHGFGQAAIGRYGGWFRSQGCLNTLEPQVIIGPVLERRAPNPPAELRETESCVVEAVAAAGFKRSSGSGRGEWFRTPGQEVDRQRIREIVRKIAAEHLTRIGIEYHLVPRTVRNPASPARQPGRP